MDSLPDPITMYDAMLRRDTSFDGIFFVGVKTTGIFCRPTCPAKMPNPENVEYFASAREAVDSGYRPCLRCRPQEKERQFPPLVRRLLDAVEESPTGKLADSDLHELGIDPSTARRQFQRHFGMTFHEYHRGRRMGVALGEIRDGESVISAQLNNGYESASGFWEAFRRTFGAPASSVGGIRCLQARWIETPLGAMLALADQEGLHLLEFVDRGGLEKEILWLQAALKASIVPGDHRNLDQVEDELKDYFGGVSREFTAPLVLTGSPFEEAVWSTLRTIPPGQTRSYAQIARSIGREGAARAVGRANGRNRLAIVVPCHRVIRIDGALCGYGGGVWRKKWLLEHERKIPG